MDIAPQLRFVYILHYLLQQKLIDVFLNTSKVNQLKSHLIELNCQFVTLNLIAWENRNDQCAIYWPKYGPRFRKSFTTSMFIRTYTNISYVSAKIIKWQCYFLHMPINWDQLITMHNKYLWIAQYVYIND